MTPIRRFLMTLACSAFIATAAVSEEEARAAFNSAGALTSLIASGRELPVDAQLEVTFPGGVSRSLQPHDQSTPVTREDGKDRWTGAVSFPNGNVVRMEAAWAAEGNGTRFTGAATAGGGTAPADAWQRRFPMHSERVDYVIDLPRSEFAGWHCSLSDASLPTNLGERAQFARAEAKSIALTSPGKDWSLQIDLDQAREVEATQVWENERRVYRLRIALAKGDWAWDERVGVSALFKWSGQGRSEPVRITRTADAPYPYDGFGANICFGTQSPSVDYILDRLPTAWARLEFKGALWQRERDNPGPMLRRDFDLMQRVQKAGIPWVLSLWRLPETFYSDPNRVPPGTFGRRIAQERWPEFLELLTGFIAYSKSKYGAEPDFFSFNEPDLGVDIGFTPETHRDAIRRIGAALRAKGFKTRLLLGDTANPRDTHKFALAAAQDPEAMGYVGAVSFHSWGGARPEFYRAWGDLAHWVGLPLIVGEAGLDPGAYRNDAYDSYSYGLRELNHLVEILRDTTPRSLLYWEYTSDYGLVRVDEAGKVTPTARFRLMEQLVTKSPMHGEVVPYGSDQGDVIAAGFQKEGLHVIHILNRGRARTCTLPAAMPSGARLFETTELESRERSASAPGSTLELPARALVTVVWDSK